MKSKNTIIVILILIILGGLIGWIIYSKVADKNRDNDTKNLSQTESNVSDDDLDVGLLIDYINDINQVLISNSYDEEEFMEDEEFKFYKYTGGDSKEIISKLNDVYKTGENSGFFRTKLSKNGRELYVSKPSDCNSIATISINDVSYEKEPDQEGNIYLEIINEDNSLFYSTVVSKDEDGIYRIDAPIDTCVYSSNIN